MIYNSALFNNCSAFSNHNDLFRPFEKIISTKELSRFQKNISWYNFFSEKYKNVKIEKSQKGCSVRFRVSVLSMTIFNPKSQAKKESKKGKRERDQKEIKGGVSLGHCGRSFVIERSWVRIQTQDARIIIFDKYLFQNCRLKRIAHLDKIEERERKTV